MATDLSLAQHWDAKACEAILHPHPRVKHVLRVCVSDTEHTWNTCLYSTPTVRLLAEHFGSTPPWSRQL